MPPADAPPKTCVTVVIPALNEAKRIASVVAYALADPATAEVVVVDDSSIDDTAALAREAGARVVTSTMLGKGPSMHDGLLAAQCEFVAYLDGDLAGLRRRVGILTANGGLYLMQELRRGTAGCVTYQAGDTYAWGPVKITSTSCPLAKWRHWGLARAMWETSVPWAPRAAMGP